MVGYVAVSFATACAAFVSPLVHTSGRDPQRSKEWRQESTQPRLLIAAWASSQNEDDESLQDEDAAKPKSRLALLAEDWLEEEEDELQMYWERFEENKGNAEATKSIPDADNTASRDEDSDLTTEQRLERYFDSRGIHKLNERKYASRIEQAIAKAQSAPTPEEAITALTHVQPYLQMRTRLGGTALYELAVALWQRDGEPDEELLRELIQKNTHVKQKVQQLTKQQSPPQRSTQNSFWQGLLDSNQWWN